MWKIPSFCPTGIVFISVSFSIASQKQEIQVTLAEKSQMKLNSLKKQKHWYLIHTWSDKASKGIVVNLAFKGLCNFVNSILELGMEAGGKFSYLTWFDLI